MLNPLRFIPLISHIIAFSMAQDLGVPTSWRKFNNSRPLSERITIAQSGINAILPQLNANDAQFNGIGYWQSGNVFSAMANQDYYARTTTNKADVVSNLNTAFKLYANFDRYRVSDQSHIKRNDHAEHAVHGQYNDDALWWATSAIYAYRAYGDTDLLSHAAATWDHVNGFVITASNAASGSHPSKNFSLQGSCEGTTMAGAVFWRPTADDQSVNSVTTGLFITLSAYLAEITKESKYKDAAILSATWIQNHNIANNIVLDSVNAHDCSRSPSDWLFTYNSGKYIEGLSILSAITGDLKWNTLMLNIIAKTVKSPPWQGEDGIIAEGSSTSSNNDGVGFKAIFIRGLLDAFSRNVPNNALRILIHSYIDVQYNALLDLAANGSTYSANWHGPPQAFTSWGQLAALDVLVSAVVAN